LGSDTENDKKVYCNNEHSRRYVRAIVSDDKNYLIIEESAGTSGVALYVQDLTRDNAPIKRIIEGYDYEYSVLGMNEGRFLVYTNDNAPRYRLISVDPRNPQRANWKEVIAEQPYVLSNVVLANNRILADYDIDVMSHLFCYNMQGEKQYEVELPGQGSLQGITADKDTQEAFFTYTSFIMPRTVYRLDVEKNVSEKYYAPEIDFNSDDYESYQVFFASKDGTRVPMTITHRKGIKRMVLTPPFSTATVVSLTHFPHVSSTT
jgi:prolyl oligopeptidase